MILLRLERARRVVFQLAFSTINCNYARTARIVSERLLRSFYA
jgi:hypothetical protein